jgi:hypothetical protein
MVMAEVCANTGRPEQAIDLLEELMSIPSLVNANILKLDPWYDSLRDNPRFQALIAKGDKVF